MAQQPPLLSSEILRRVIRMARFDGIGVLLISGLFALYTASLHDVPGAALGLAVAAAGAVELHGAGLLIRGEDRGANWLEWSQLLVLGLILGSAIFRLTHVDVGALREFFVSYYRPEDLATLKEIPQQYGLSNQAALRMAYQFSWGLIGLITLFYQGGMVIYYRRRRKAVFAALQE